MGRGFSPLYRWASFVMGVTSIQKEGGCVVPKLRVISKSGSALSVLPPELGCCIKIQKQRKVPNGRGFLVN